MSLAPRTTALLTALLYPLQGHTDLSGILEKVMEKVVRGGVLEAKPDEYLAAIREALATEEHLAGLVPQDNAEGVIRQYLTDIAAAIEKG